jgi:hypothetical protein
MSSSGFRFSAQWDPRASVRLLLFSFVADMRFVDIVSARRRTKGLSPRRLEVIDDEVSIDASNATTTVNSKSNNIYTFSAAAGNHVLTLPPLQLPSIRSSMDSFVVPPPPPIMPSVFGSAEAADIMSKSLSNQLVNQMRDAARAELDAEIDAAVEKATQTVRARYESRLQQSQDEVRALRNQVEQLQRQLAQMTIGSPLIKAEFLCNPQGDSNDSSIDDFLTSSVSSLKMSSPPRKRRQVVEGGVAAPAAVASSALHASSSTTLCRESVLFEMPHSPTEATAFVY